MISRWKSPLLASALLATMAAAPCAAELSCDRLMKDASLAFPDYAREDMKAARARLAVLLGQNGLDKQFDAVEDRTTLAKIRHKASGALCAAGDRIITATDTAVDCTHAGANGSFSELSATRAPAGATVDQATDAALRMVGQEPGYLATAGDSLVWRTSSRKPTVAHRTLAFLSQVNGVRSFTRMDVGIVGGWIWIERHTNRGDHSNESGFDQCFSDSSFGTLSRFAG